jgi:bacillithiol biosynthesis cysteine-adding enzyme BshC
VGPEIAQVLDRLAADLQPSEYRDQVLDLFRRWYRPEATLADSCAHTLAELLSPFGVVVFDATHPAVKRAQMPQLLQALTRAGELEKVLVERHATLVAAGADPGVTVGDGATLVMFEGQLGRDRLAARPSGFTTRRSREQLSLAEVERFAQDDPGRFSPNVLLRPAVESALLPTVAYVAGPGELKYLALAEAIYAPLRIVRQRPLPRWSGVLVDARTDRVLEKFGASLEELLQPGQKLEARVVRAQMPAEAVTALQDLREAVRVGYDTLARAAVTIDSTIEKPIRNLAQQAQSGADDAEKRLVNHLKKRQATETQQIARARELVLPLGKPQERVHTIAPWLARYGPPLLEELLEVITSWFAAGLEGAPRPR